MKGEFFVFDLQIDAGCVKTESLDAGLSGNLSVGSKVAIGSVA